MPELLTIPYPTDIRHKNGQCKLESVCTSLGAAPQPHFRWALERLQQEMEQNGISWSLVMTDKTRPPAPTIPLRFNLDERLSSETYTISISTKTIRVNGHDQRALAYATETLTQLIRQFRNRLPCLLITDQPQLAQRGFYLDISRGKVPLPSTLQALIDRLASLKYNQLQLYMEHTFDFLFDPDIGSGSGALSAQDILALDAHCSNRGIELVPSFTCFGHMGKILSLPQYRNLAEVPFPAPSWEKATWRQRLRGATLDIRRAGSKRLIRNILAELLPAFSSTRINVCGDETYDLGKGRNISWADKHGLGTLYLEHLLFVREEAAALGRSIMCWSDVLLQHPGIIQQLPDDITVLDWGYEVTTRFEKLSEFTRRGLPAMGVPSTRSFRVMFNEVETARLNIMGYARSALEHKADGLLITDWGDMGHYNLPAASLHGLALGGALSWNPEGPFKKSFDRAFSLQVFHDRKDRFGGLFRRAGTCPCSSWPRFLEDLSSNSDLPDPAAVEKTLDTVSEGLRMLSSSTSLQDKEPAVCQELVLALNGLSLNAQKVDIQHALKEGRSVRRQAIRLADRFDAFRKDFSNHWKTANNSAGLSDLEQAFKKQTRQIRKVESSR